MEGDQTTKQSARMNPLATDLVAIASAVFDLYADEGMLRWDAFPTVVRGSGLDPTESQLAEMWANTTGTIADGGRSENMYRKKYSVSILHSDKILIKRRPG